MTREVPALVAGKDAAGDLHPAREEQNAMQGLEGNEALHKRFGIDDVHLGLVEHPGQVEIVVDIVADGPELGLLHQPFLHQLLRLAVHAVSVHDNDDPPDRQSPHDRPKRNDGRQGQSGIVHQQAGHGAPEHAQNVNPSEPRVQPLVPGGCHPGGEADDARQEHQVVEHQVGKVEATDARVLVVRVRVVR